MDTWEGQCFSFLMETVCASVSLESELRVAREKWKIRQILVTHAVTAFTMSIDVNRYCEDHHCKW